MRESIMRQTLALARRLGHAACVLVPPAAGADVYKCAGEGGIPVYQEVPCGPAKELRNFQLDPPEITILPAPRAGTPAGGIKEAPARNAKSDKNGKPAPKGPPINAPLPPAASAPISVPPAAPPPIQAQLRFLWSPPQREMLVVFTSYRSPFTSMEERASFS